MMKRLSFVLIVLALTFVQRIHAQYYSVNYDARTVAAMAAAFGTEALAESYYREQVDDILKHYTAAEVAAAGIFASKFLEHKALSDLGIWSSSTENYYYRRIYHMVAEKIMPKIWAKPPESAFRGLFSMDALTGPCGDAAPKPTTCNPRFSVQDAESSSLSASVIFFV